MTWVHSVTVECNGRTVKGWRDYQVSVDMLQPADAFSLSVTFDLEAWALLGLDSEITVYVDDTRILSGFIDQREKSSDKGGGTTLTVSGRDRSGRLVDESAPLFSYGGLYLRDLCKLIVGDWFESVTLQNTTNRRLLRGAKAKQGKERRSNVTGGASGVLEVFRGWPAVSIVVDVLDSFGRPTGAKRRVTKSAAIEPGIFGGRAAETKVSPGSSRWAVLENVLREARLLGWSTADGKSLFVGLPNYDQDPQWFFYEGQQRGATRNDTNAQIQVRESVAERYSTITCCGKASGKSANYGRNLQHRATVKDNAETADGTGISFRHRKALLISDDSVTCARDALERAEREKLERDAHAQEITVEVAGHGQVYQGATTDRPAIYAIDTMARVIDADTGISGDYLVTSVEFTQSRSDGTKTKLQLVPKGAQVLL